MAGTDIIKFDVNITLSNKVTAYIDQGKDFVNYISQSHQFNANINEKFADNVYIDMAFSNGVEL